MTGFLRGMVRAVVETFELPVPVVEIGSYQVAGQEDLINLRSFFDRQHCEPVAKRGQTPAEPGGQTPFCNRLYLGIDVRSGPGVDRVEDVQDLSLPDASAGTVLALNTFEHVPCFWQGFDEVFRVLRPDGALLVSCPFHFHIHNYPSDYWRFTPEALQLLLKRYPSKIIGWHGPRTRPTNVWALAFREQRAPITTEQYLKYRSLMARYAREPLSWFRRVRYLLGRLLCGRRPFAPYLDRDCWDSVCLTDPKPRQLRRTTKSTADSWCLPA